MASESSVMRLLPNLLLLSIGPGTELPWRLVVLNGAQNCRKATPKASSVIHIDSVAVCSGRCTNRQHEEGRGGMESTCRSKHSGRVFS
jgi:hypothetical protein